MQSVLTNRGIIPAKDVLPGDFLYEYGTSKPLEITYIDIAHDRKMYDVRYTDGRVEKISEDENIYFNDKLYGPEEFTREMFDNVKPIKRFVTDYGKLYQDLDPDPYTAGALLIYGDLDDPYINLPADRAEADDVLIYKYHLTYATDTNSTKKYYSYIGSEEKIKWVDFFKGYTFFSKTHILDDPIIPDEYMYAGVADRLQFISGAFDVGYSPLVTPDTVSMVHTDIVKLQIVQRMLWSLGIMTYLHTSNNTYQLDVIGPEEDYAKFFYNIDFRSRMISNIVEVYKCNPTFELKVESVTPSLFSYKVPRYYIYTEKPGQLYYSAQYLPRVTI